MYQARFIPKRSPWWCVFMEVRWQPFGHALTHVAISFGIQMPVRKKRMCAVSVRENPRGYRARRRRSHFFRRGARILGQHCSLTSKSKRTAFYGRGRIRTAVDGSETNVCLYWEQGWGSAGCSGRAHWPVRRPGEEGAPRIEHCRSARR